MLSEHAIELILGIVLAGLTLWNTYMLRQTAAEATRQRQRLQSDVTAIKGNGHKPTDRTRHDDPTQDDATDLTP